MPGGAPLVSIAGAPVPDHGTAEWFGGAEGVTLRAACFFPAGQSSTGGPRGSVIVSPGRSEPIEKYYEVVDDLLARGFAVLVHDWRGQGLSARALPDRLKGHAKGFKPFLADYTALLDAFEDRLPKPWIAVGHSMGGCLTTLALAQGEDRFAACVLSAPMFGVDTGRRPPRASRALAWIMARAGFAGDYTPGEISDPFADSFATDALTHDRARFDRYRAQLLADRDLALGGVTWGWVDFAFSACAWLGRSPGVEAITIPVTVVAASQDTRVLNADLRSIAGRIPKGRYIEVEDAFHEILIERDDLRAQFWAAFDETVEAAAPRRATSPTA
ncbi:MAG: alpha/beta hydrolase [Alphaproteobacteria bacterium]|nr:alpha/beta hydrolase [Alphaproteobacteria bacterium]